MTGNSWAWQMDMPHEDDSHEVFWRQMLRWLAGSAPDQVDLAVDRNVIPEGEAVTLAVEVNDPTFTKLNDAQVTATITPPSSKPTEMPLQWVVKKDGIYQGDYRPAEKGHLSRPSDSGTTGERSWKSERFFAVTDSNMEVLQCPARTGSCFSALLQKPVADTTRWTMQNSYRKK